MVEYGRKADYRLALISAFTSSSLQIVDKFLDIDSFELLAIEREVHQQLICILDKAEAVLTVAGGSD